MIVPLGSKAGLERRRKKDFHSKTHGTFETEGSSYALQGAKDLRDFTHGNPLGYLFFISRYVYCGN